MGGTLFEFNDLLIEISVKGGLGCKVPVFGSGDSTQLIGRK